MTDTCTNCNAILSPTSTSCPSCGSPRRSQSSGGANAGGFCGSCGTALASKYSPCPKCGYVKTKFTPPPQYSPQYSSQGIRPSSAWWLLPIFFGWVGGLISWVCIRERDPRMAKNNLILGIVLSVIPLIIILIAVYLGSPSNPLGLEWGAMDAQR